MKPLRLLPLLSVLILTSCASVRVAADYDKEANFNTYNSYAFYKPGIDEAKISDLDKKRILRAIDAELAIKGMNKSQSPDLLVSIFTKHTERIDVFNRNFGWGWGWNPFWLNNGFNTGSHSTQEGTLYIDLIDAKTNSLVWQGVGHANLEAYNIEKKEARIKEIVKEIVAKYPPMVASN